MIKAPKPGTPEAVAALQQGKHSLRIQLFDDVTVSVAIDRVSQTVGGTVVSGRAWRDGSLVGAAAITITGSGRGPTVIADFDLGTDTVKLYPVAPGIEVVARQDPRVDQGLSDDTIEAPNTGETVPMPPTEAPNSPPGLEANSSTGTITYPNTPEVTVLVLYTSNAASALGFLGSSPASFAASKIDGVTSETMARTGLNYPFRTVAVLPVSYNEGLIRTDLTNLGAGNGAFASVASWRAQYRADLVLLYGYGWGAQACGLAYRPTNPNYGNRMLGFSLVDVSAACDATVSAHELGHNLGLNHDLPHSDSPHFAPDDNAWRRPDLGRATVMSYTGGGNNCICVLNWQYSNPNLYFPGPPPDPPPPDPNAWPAVAGDWNEANAARILALTLPVFSRFDGSPIGNFESEVVAPGGVRVKGWSLDYDSPNSSTQIQTYIDGAPGPAFTANVTRTDVGAAYPGTGNTHGFSEIVPVGLGTHTVCVYAINLGANGANTTLGCGTITLDGSPFGNSDATAAVQGGVYVRGWAIDPDINAPTSIHVYADGVGIGVLTTSEYRGDIFALFPDYNPAARGYSATLYLAPGTRNVCTYAINTTNGGTNTLLGCTSVTVSGNTFGNFESNSRAPGGLRVRGWSIDPASTGTTPVHFYIDGGAGGTAVVYANQSRPDIGSAFPYFGPNHGFNAIIAVPSTGTHSICAYGIKIAGSGANTLLGCQTVTMSGDPGGSVDDVSKNGTAIHVRGWTVDPDTAASSTVHVYVDGANVGILNANLSRPDVGAALPDYGANHGFEATIASTPGLHSVCIYGINLAGPGTNPLLNPPCTSVTV